MISRRFDVRPQSLILLLSTALLVAPSAAQEPTRQLKPASIEAERAPDRGPLPMPRTITPGEVTVERAMTDEPDFAPAEDVRDGRGNVVEIRRTGNPYVLAFTGGSYTPPRGIDSDLAKTLQANPGSSTYGFVMIRGRMSEAKMQQLRALGLQLLGVHTWQSVKAKIPAKALAGLRTLPFVHWVGYARNAQKVGDRLARQLNAAAAGEGLRVWVHPFASDLCGETERRAVGAADRSQRSAVTAPSTVVVPNGPFHKELQRRGFAFLHYDEMIHAFEVQASKQQILALIQRDWVHAVELSQTYYTSHDQAMPMLAQDQVRRTYKGTRVPVGIIDTGLDSGPWHRDFLGKQFVGWSTVSGRTPWDDRNGHGQHVTGTVCGTGAADSRFVGAAPAVGHGGATDRIYIGKFLSDNGSSQGNASWHYANFARNYTQNGQTSPYPRLINCSWGAAAQNGYHGTEAMARSADNYVYTYKQLYVFAAGNKQTSTTTFWTQSPGSAKNVLTVGAVRDTFSGLSSYPGQRASFSLYGVRDGRTKPEVTAPGNITTSCAINTATGYVGMSGTSMATPAVVGCLASLIQAQAWFKDKPEAMKAMAVATATNGGEPRWNLTTGYGLINSAKMVWSGSTTWQVRNGRFTSANQSASFNIPVGSDVKEVRAVLCWSEPAASANATVSRVCDLRGFVDAPPYTSNNSSGDWNLLSSRENCLVLTNRAVAAAIRGKTVRFKIHARSIPSGYAANWAVVFFMYRKDPWATTNRPTLSVIHAQAVKPGSNVSIWARMNAQSQGDQFSNARLWVNGPFSWRMRGMRRITADGITNVYSPSNVIATDRFPRVAMGINGGITLGAGNSRQVEFQMQAPNVDGRYQVDVRGTWHSNASTAPFARALANICVDRLGPPRVQTLRSTSHTVGQWSNKTSFTATWSRAVDSGCAGVLGLRTLLSHGSAAVPTKINLAGDKASQTLTIPGESTLGYYFNVLAHDRAGNVASAVNNASIGPFKIDLQRPSMVSVKINGGAAATNSARVAVQVVAGDSRSGVADVRYSGNNVTWSSWLTFSTGARTVDMTSLGWGSGTGRRFVYAQVRDRAGNISTTGLGFIYVRPAATISSVPIASQPNVTYGYFRLLGRDFTGTRKVTMAGRVITASWASAHQDWWADGAIRVVSDTELHVYPPQGLRPGSHSLVVDNGRNSGGVAVRVTANARLFLGTQTRLTAGKRQTVVVAQGRQPNAGLVVVAYSPVRSPSAIPGFVSLGLGNNWTNYSLAPRHAFNANKVALGAAPTPAALRNMSLHFQAVVLGSSVPLPTSNLVSTLYR